MCLADVVLCELEEAGVLGGEGRDTMGLVRLNSTIEAI
jgi:hypothetical protein